MQKLGKTQIYGCGWKGEENKRIKKITTTFAVISTVMFLTGAGKLDVTQAKTGCTTNAVMSKVSKNLSITKNEIETIASESDEEDSLSEDETGDSQLPEELAVGSTDLQDVPVDAGVVAAMTGEQGDNPEELEQTDNQKPCYYTATDEEKIFLYKLVYAESGHESALGQTLVANSIINRAKSCGQTIIEVGCAKNQFSPVRKGVIYTYSGSKLIPVTDDMISDDLKAAVDAALEEDCSIEILKTVAQEAKIDDPKYWEKGVLYFYNPEICDEKQIAARKYVKVSFEYGDHVFYSFWDKK